jgi:aspartate/methionine/tyrosine aminotransferase
MRFTHCPRTRYDDGKLCKFRFCWHVSGLIRGICILVAFLIHVQREGHGFQSIIRALDNQLGTDVHMVWAASKDIGSSGMRYGVLYSQNELLLKALASPAVFSCVSGPIQYLVSELLTDDVFVDNFLDESRRRLLYNYNICTRKLEEMVLPFIPAEAGIFVYVDFSSLLPEPTFEWEEKLSELMFQVRVVLTPGESQRDTTPGMFRICYAWVTPEVLEIAMERLSKLVAKLRRMEWVDINDRALSNILYN